MNIVALGRDHTGALIEFFARLPAEDLTLMREDVIEPNTVRGWADRPAHWVALDDAAVVVVGFAAGYAAERVRHPAARLLHEVFAVEEDAAAVAPATVVAGRAQRRILGLDVYADRIHGDRDRLERKAFERLHDLDVARSRRAEAVRVEHDRQVADQMAAVRQAVVVATDGRLPEREQRVAALEDASVPCDEACVGEQVGDRLEVAAIDAVGVGMDEGADLFVIVRHRCDDSWLSRKAASTREAAPGLAPPARVGHVRLLAERTPADTSRATSSESAMGLTAGTAGATPMNRI